VSATMNLMTFVFGVGLATLMTGWLHGADGLRQAWDPWQILRYLPVGVLFGVSQSMVFMAYASHVPASIVTVLGFIYMPIAAIGKRLVLDKFTTWLQWVALIIITVASMTFGEMQADSRKGSGGARGGMSNWGLMYVVMSATLAALGSLVMEKMLGDEKKPFYIQKVALDMGSVFTSVVMFFVQGSLSERPMDAFWADRPLGRCDDMNCWGPVGSNSTCASQACSCLCDHGVFVNWDSCLVWFTLVIITARVWMKGEVTKKTSTLEVAIAEAFAPILIYFVGQPVAMYLEGKSGVLETLSDWALNCVVFITPLSAMVFDVAESKMRMVMDSVDPDYKADEQCCPLHQLLVIVSRLENADAQQTAPSSKDGSPRSTTSDESPSTGEDVQVPR